MNTTKPRDRVERETFMRAPIDKVFAALTDPAQFPTWGPERVTGRIAPGERPIFDFGWSGKCAVYVVAVEAPRYFAYRWIQGVQDPEILLTDPLAHPNNTLVEFHLDETGDGRTRVRVVESGIDKLPPNPAVNIDDSLEQMGKGWELMIGGLPRHFTFVPGDTLTTEISVPAATDRVHALLLDPKTWWMGAPPVEVTDHGPTHVSYVWNRGPATTRIDFKLAAAGDAATHVTHTESGFAAMPDSTFEAKRAHQGWGVILAMLQWAASA
jgi:uncharacterized protein YndB with AHSA1/START domain